MDAAEIEKFVGDLELAVDRLRSLYEQYFMGIEKLEPTVPRKDVDRRIQVLRKEQIRNTAQRFRFQMILQRYNTYQTHWQRICREIENGTYKRHVVRARQRFNEEGRRRSTLPPGAAGAAAAAGRALPMAQPGVSARSIEEELAELDADFAPMEELGGDDLELIPDSAPARAAKPAAAPGPVWRKAEPTAPKRPLAPSPPPPPPVPAPKVAAIASAPSPASPAAPRVPVPQGPPRGAPAVAAAPTAPAAQRPVPSDPQRIPRPAAPPARPYELPDERVRQLYAQYVETKRQQKESTAAITFEAVAKSLRESGAKLREKHGKPVDFEVAVKDGKTILKPVLK